MSPVPRSPRSLLLAAAAVLAFAAPVQAANPDAPGAQKKQPITTDTPAQAPVTAAPVPTQDTTPQAPVKQAPVKQAPVVQQKTNATTPLNKGTLKKLVPAQPAPTTSTPSRSSTTTRRPAHRTATRHSAAPVHRRTTSATRNSSSTHSGSRSPAGTAQTSAAAQALVAAAATKSAAAAQARAHRVAARAHASAKAAAHTPAQDKAPLASISRAADRVIEVIPGAVVLALAGLVALVFLLILRSWSMERRRSMALADSYGVTVEALATAIEAKDHTTGGHIERVRRLGLLLAAEIVPREVRDPQMAYGFLLHDIGKLAVPDAILRAPGRLTEEQWAQIRRHPEEGVRMLGNIPFLGRALDVVAHHHERWDGGGYPNGLVGREIPLWARIFSVVDALDAITAERPYRPGRSYSDAVEEIRRHAGTQFDPDVVEALERLDPAAIEPLLEPTQQIELVREPLEVLPVPDPLVAA